MISFGHRNRIAAAVAAVAVLAAIPTHAEEEKTIEVSRVGSVPSAKGPAEWFTGTVRVDPLCRPPRPIPGVGRQCDL